MKNNKNSNTNLENKNILSKDTRLSKAAIWKLLEEQYKKLGPTAWDQIPFYPTSNPFIAEAYAELIMFALLDYRDHIQFDQPFYIIEFAAGSGCFSFYLIKNLIEKFKYFPMFEKLKLKYIMTDFTQNNIDAWREHEKLIPYQEEGILDFALFRPEDDKSLHFQISNQTLNPGEIKNPIIALANYFFDSICQDAFRIENHELKEVLVTFYGDISKTPLDFTTFTKTENYQSLKQNKPYADDDFNAVLKRYQDEHENASILFPLGPLNVIKNLQELSDNNLILISADKGFTYNGYMHGLYEQSFFPHHQVFSYMVNYHAIARYFETIQGHAFVTSDKSPTIAIGFFAKLKENTSFRLTNYYFKEKLDKQNLPNTMYYGLSFITGEEQNRLKALLHFIRLCNYDPVAFSLANNEIYKFCEKIDSGTQDALVELLDKAKENFYSPRQEYNIPFNLGRIYYVLGYYDDALACYMKSFEITGANEPLYFNIGACHEMKGDYVTALDYYQKSQGFGRTVDPVTIESINRVKDKLGMK